MKQTLLTVLAFTVASVLFGGYKYAQLYKQDSNETATSGILFKKSLHLDKYQKVSSGNGLLGNYDNYSRSDRHNELVTVYCKNWCTNGK